MLTHYGNLASSMKCGLLGLIRLPQSTGDSGHPHSFGNIGHPYSFGDFGHPHSLWKLGFINEMWVVGINQIATKYR